MKHHPFKTLILIHFLETVLGGQFKWGTYLLKGNGGVYLRSAISGWKSE